MANLRECRFATFFVAFIGVVLLVSCSARKHENPVDPDYDGIQYTMQGGFVQKGPFYASGSSITVHEWNDKFTPIENIYSTAVTSNLGRYSLAGKVNSRYCEVTAEGYYFDEVSGGQSDQTLVLSTLVDVSTEDTINVNVLTTLAEKRIRYLYMNGKKSFSEARAQAEKEVLDVFNVTDSDVLNFNQMDLGLNGASHDILLAVSAMCQGNLSASDVYDLLYQIADDLEQDGNVGTTTLGEIRDNARDISLLTVEENIEDYFGDFGVTISKEGFRDYVEAVYEDIPPTCGFDHPADGDTLYKSTNTDESSPVEMTASVSDIDGNIWQVAFYVDDILCSTDDTSPFSCTWESKAESSGNHTIKAVAMDDDGKETSYSIQVILDTSSVIGTWMAEYSGYDPNTDDNVTMRRKLVIAANSAYSDSLWGQPSSQSTESLFEMEIGTWKINTLTDIIYWHPTLAKQVDLSSSSGEMDIYYPGDHSDDLDIDTGGDSMEWEFIDTVLDPDVTYTMKKEK